MLAIESRYLNTVIHTLYLLATLKDLNV